MVLLRSVVAAAAIFSSTNANALIPSYGSSCPASDKCLKAVKANGSASRDCKAALQKTVTVGKPCTKTVYAKSTKTITQTSVAVNTVLSTITTITVTPTQTTTETPALPPRNEKRAASPPTYATKSCNANQYKSACSCVGVLPSTKTVAPPEKTTTLTRTTTVKQTVTSTTTALATATVTVNPDDAVPTGQGCSRNGIYQLYAPSRRISGGDISGYLFFDSNGVATLGYNHREGSNFAITRSGLFRDLESPNLALSAAAGDGLTYVFGSEDITGDTVVRCTIENGDFQCSQGDKNVFLSCPANADGSTVAIANQDAVDAGTVGEGCQQLYFQLADPCNP